MEFAQTALDAVANFSPSEFYAKQKDFTWDKSALPLANDHWLVTTPLLYVSAVFLLRAVVPEGGIPLGPLPILHNIVLVVWCAGGGPVCSQNCVGEVEIQP